MQPLLHRLRPLKVLCASAAALAVASAASAATPTGATAAGTRARPADTSAPASGKPLRVVVAFEPVEASSNTVSKAVNFEIPLTKALGVPVIVAGDRSLREIAIGTRSGDYDALWVPSNLAVSAAKDPQYELAGFDGHMTQMALVVAPGVQKFDDLRRRTLYLPQEDSSATAVGTALLSDHGLRVGDFTLVYSTGSYEVATFAIARGFCAATVMPAAQAKSLLAATPGAGRILEVSEPVPGQTLVVRKSLSPTRKKQLAEWAASQASIDVLAPATPAAFKYVTGLTHYTPEDVPGVKKVLANEVVALQKEGVAVVDVRTTAEYDAKHIPSAQLVPYTEESQRFIGADASKDSFDLTKLANIKKVILYCNGPECWKSFKAAQRAIASKQFESVYWFRGGIPEWERAGLPIARGGALSASN